MATKLQCEICGGKLIGKPGGVFECESCGTEYSTEWAKAKIQEISGTVKIEGTVEVTGKVQIEGGTVQVDTTANKDSLAKRAFLLLEDCNWAKANELFEQVLNLDPEYADAYLGMALADLHLKSLQEVATIGADKHNTDESVRIRILDQGKNEIPVIRTVREATGLGSIEAKRLIKDSSFFSATIQQAMNLKNAGAKIEYERGILDPSLSVQTIEKNSSFIKYLRFAKPSESEKTKEYLAQAKQLAKDADYQRAKSLMAENTYAGYREAAKLFRMLKDYPDSRQCEALCTEQMDRIRAEKRKQASLVSSRITTNYDKVIALSADGTLLSADQYFFSWVTDLKKDIVSIKANNNVFYAVKEDGTVTATSFGGLIQDYGQLNVTSWRNIVSIATGWNHTVGLKKNGTLVAIGDNQYGQCNVGNWSDIIAIDTCNDETIGLKKDGTVVSTDPNRILSDWKDIVQISFPDVLYVLKKDGIFQIDDVADWSDIVAISAERHHIVGLKADGTVVAAFLSDDPDHDHGQCDVSDWTDIVAISTGLRFTVGVKKDGTIVSAGDVFGMSEWKLFNNIDTLEEEISEARKLQNQREEQRRREAEQKRAEAIGALKQEIASARAKTQALETELANLKGLFTGKRRKELEEQLDASYKKIRELQTKLNKMQ